MLLKVKKDNEKSAAFILKIYKVFRMKHLIPPKAIFMATQSSFYSRAKINGNLRRKSALSCAMPTCLCLVVSLAVVFIVMLDDYSMAKHAEVLGKFRMNIKEMV